jgi:NitT/TauT family transport system substrate-binding protein
MGRRAEHLLALACVATLSACGGGEAGPGADEAVTLDVGVIPIADVAPLYLGMQKGFFAAEKLTIRPRLQGSGAAILPAVVSGRNDVGFSNTTTLIIASAQGKPVKIISQGDIGGKGPEDAPDALLVGEDSRIRAPEDLQGRTVGVNSLRNVGPLTINRALERFGVDYRSVRYVEVPFAEASAALESGRVDAAWVVEPFATQLKSSGARVLFNPFVETSADLTVATYFTTEGFIEENPGVVRRFVRAMNRSLAYARTHSPEVRRVVSTYTDIPPATLAQMRLPQWEPDLHEDTIRLTSDLAAKYGWVKEAPGVDELIHRPG